MKTKISRLALASLLTGFALFSQAAFAGTATSTVNATLNVAGTCSFSQPNYSVNVNAVIGTKPTANVQVLVTCSSGVTATLQQAYAVAYSGSGAAGEIEAVAYKDAGNTVPLNGNSINLTADGGQYSYTIYYLFRDYQSQGPLQKSGTFNISMPMQVNF